MKTLRPADFIILFLAAGITLFCAINVYGKNGGSLQLIIEGKSGRWIYPLTQTARVDIPGVLGSTRVIVEDGRARVAASPCDNQSCVGSGSIRRKGEWIACLPNAVMLRIEARETYADANPRASAGGKNKGHAELDGAVW